MSKLNQVTYYCSESSPKLFPNVKMYRGQDLEFNYLWKLPLLMFTGSQSNCGVAQYFANFSCVTVNIC